MSNLSDKLDASLHAAGQMHMAGLSLTSALVLAAHELAGDPGTEGGSMTIAGFLEARLAEDQYKWEGDADWGDSTGTCYECGASQARMLREVEAKRKILAAHEQVPRDLPPDFTYSCLTCFTEGTCETLNALASVYSGHPDCDPAWAPEGASA